MQAAQQQIAQQAELIQMQTIANATVASASVAQHAVPHDVSMDAQDRLTVINDSVKKIAINKLPKDVDSAIKQAVSEMRKKLDGLAKSSLHVKKLEQNMHELKSGVIAAGIQKFALPF